MAAFLSKVFPRKKDKETSNKRNSSSSLLEGKFEAVSPTVSPSAAHFVDSAQQIKDGGREKEKEKEGGFTLFRPKSRPVSPPPPDARKTVSNAPHLTLNLPVPKEERSRALGVVFEADPNDTSILPDNVVGDRRLTPLETLLLVKACSQAIIDNGGLETLGVMHPFWYSASPEVQRKLISLFVLSLGSKTPITTLSPSPTSAATNFNSELEYTRSPHDIAAVLRWALRHLRLEGESFGRGSGQWNWYQAFSEAERASSFPPSAFTDVLVPQVPPSHHQLLVATLDIVSSLASHAERNSISGSKLSKFLGLWLLTTKRSEDGEDWNAFYARWERAGRILEHLFLAHIRDEMVQKQMPLRLAELVKGYPYHNRNPSADATPISDDDLLPRPRFSTRQYNALFVRVDTEVSDTKATKRKPHPLRLISDALKSDIELNDAQYKSVWEAIRTAALADDEPDPILSHVDGYPSLSRVFADETTRLLSFVPAESGNAASSVPTIRLPRPPRRRSSSLNSPTQPQANGNGKGGTNGSAKRTLTSPISPVSSTTPKDWSDFSTSGFGESTLGMNFAKTLLDADVEVTNPPSVERKTSKRRKLSPRRASVDGPHSDSATRATEPSSAPQHPKSKSTIVSLIQLDEAFIDFWNDALLDPISSDWPNFVVAQLKALPAVEVDGKPIGWLVLEQRFLPPLPPPPTTTEESAASPAALRRASSPKPSIRSEMSARKSSTFSAAKKRLTFFSSSSQTISNATVKSEARTTTRKKASKSPRVGEMGEILPEVEEKPEEKHAEKEVAPAPAESPKVPEPKAAEQVTPAEPKAAEELKVAEELNVVAEPEIAPTEGVQEIIAVDSTGSAPPLSPTTPTADDFPTVPVVGGGLAAAAATVVIPVAVESLKTEDAVVEDKPVVEIPAEQPLAAIPAPEEKALPPAPESVVLTGETPGPQVALSTSEPVALAEVSAKVDKIVEEASSSPEPESKDARTTDVVPEPVQVEEVVPLATPVETPTESAAVEEVKTQEPAPLEPEFIAAVSTPEVETSAPGETAAVAEVAAVKETNSIEETPAPKPESSAPVIEPAVETLAPVVEEINEPTQETVPVTKDQVIAEEVSTPTPPPELVVEETLAVPEPVAETVSAVQASGSEPEVTAAIAEPEPTPERQPVSHIAAPAPVEEATAAAEPTQEDASLPAAPLEEAKTEGAPTKEPAVVEEPGVTPLVEEPAAPVDDEQFAAPATAEESTVSTPEPDAEASAVPSETIAHVEEAPVEDAPAAEQSAVAAVSTETAPTSTPAEPVAQAPLAVVDKSLEPASQADAAAAEKHENGSVEPAPETTHHAEEKPAAAEESQ